MIKSLWHSATRPLRRPDGVLSVGYVVWAMIPPIIVMTAIWMVWLHGFEDKVPLEILSTNVPESSYEPGDFLTYEVTYCKYTTSRAEKVNIQWENTLVYMTPETTPPYSPNGCRNTVSSVYIPKHLPPDIYTLRVTVVYQVNFLRERFVSYTVGPIIVEEP